MTHVQFTPAFEGDEYLAHGFECPAAGIYEVDDELAAYLVETFGDRFSLQAPATGPKAPTNDQESTKTAGDESDAQSAPQDAGKGKK